MKYMQEEIKQISEGKPSEIAQFITSLLERIEKFENRVKGLERQADSNRRNSSKSPSSDGLRKPKRTCRAHFKDVRDSRLKLYGMNPRLRQLWPFPA